MGSETKRVYELARGSLPARVAVTAWASADLDAGAFAFVMATGIVSVAARLQGLPVVSDALLAVACVGWIVLAATVSARVLRSGRGRPRLQSFAFIAATAVLGVRFTIAGDRTLAVALWSLALLGWVLLLAWRPDITQPAGSSLLVVVATESLAVLAALLATPSTSVFLVVALVTWLLGLALYPLVTAAIVVALSHGRRFAPDLWIVMGALAIATLAGSELLLTGRKLHILEEPRRLLPDIAFATWAFASALVVPLFVLELRERRRWRYAASRWSFVFPLGMYAVASRTLGRADGVALLQTVGTASFAIAIAAWAVTLVGLTRKLLHQR